MKRWLTLAVGLSLTGCVNLGQDLAGMFPDRRAEINAAYQRGEISFAQREQLLNDYDRQQQANFVNSQLAAKQFQQSSQYQPPATMQPVKPLNAPDYMIYDQSGRQVGTLRSR